MLGRILSLALVVGLVTGCSCASDTDPAATDAGPATGDGAIPMTDGGGVDGAMCPDMDGDGVDACSDCDDTDPTTYPGATEVCGDGITNDCSMNPPDTGCMGIGTYVAEPPLGMPPPMMPGGPGGLGTQARPVDTIRQGIMNAMTIGGGVEVFVAAGTYDEDIVMVEDISVLGGHDPAAGWTRDPAANVSTVNATTAAGVTFRVGITRITAIDGFTINGLSGGNSSDAITINRRSSPTISNNIINGGNTGGQSNAIRINPMNTSNSGRPLIENNEINMGQARGGWGMNNGANGVWAQQTRVELLNNLINLANDDIIQSAIVISQSPATSLLDGNVIRGTGRSEFAFGMRVGGSVIAVRNNDVDPGACSNGCRGISTGGQGIQQTFENNIVFGGESGNRTVAFAVEYEAMIPMPPPEMEVHSNFFHGGTGSGFTIGASLGECPNVPFQVGRFRNNIIYSGEGSNRYAFSEDNPNIDPEVFENNALYLMPGGSGAIYRDEGLPMALMCIPSGSGSDVTTASAVDGASGGSGTLENDCSVTNPTVGGDFHLMAGSMCIDAGVTAAAPSTDYEGDARPMGSAPDIGPDEAG